jgi:Spy/CpxP family protein refolding chaperone
MTTLAARLRSLLLALAVLAAAPALARAEPGGPDQKRAEVRQRIKQLRHQVLLKEVGLDEAKAAAVERVLEKHSAERRAARERAAQHRAALQKLLDAGSNDQKAYATAIRGLRDAQKQRAAQRERELDELAKLLTPKQQAQLLRATERLKKRLAHRVREKRRGGRD